MTETSQTKKYEHDVFILYASGDQVLAEEICGELEKHSLKCMAQFKPDAFPAGTYTLDNAVKYVSCSGKTVLILTDESLKSSWVTFETILALEESQRSNSLRLLVLHNVDENERFLKNGLLESVPRIKFHGHKSEWGKELANEIQKDVPMTDILPFGSMAHGLVFSHYTGFLRYVVPVLKEKIKDSNIYKEKPNAVSFKYFMLLPESGKIRNDLTSESEGMKIEKTGEKLEFEKLHAGKQRKITLSLYKIAKGSEEYYFFADFPNVLNSMYQIEEEKIAMIDIKFQMAKFFFTMNEMVNHSENVECHDTVQLLRYNDHKESMQMILWKAVSDSVSTEHATTRMKNMHINKPKQPVEKQNEKQSDEPKLDATISCYEGNDKDREIQIKIEDYLKESGKSVEPGSSPGGSRFQLKEAKWHVFILSKEAIEKPNELPTVCMSAMAQDLNDNVLRVLVVIRDIEPRQVPRFIKCINMLKTEENYCEQLLQTMNGGILKLEHAMPCGDVATGLAWAYVINYLQVTLLGVSSEETGKLDFRGRIVHCLKENKRPEGCALKLFLVLPKSCKTGDLADKVKEGFTDKTCPVTYVDKLLPVILNTGGQIGRHVYHHMYLMEDPKTSKKTCFLAEYCTPAKCMREMVEQYKFAGLQEDEMERQCEEFANLLPQILKKENVIKQLGDISQLAELVFYDEQKETLFTAIKRHVLADGLPVVFADK